MSVLEKMVLATPSIGPIISPLSWSSNSEEASDSDKKKQLALVPDPMFIFGETLPPPDEEIDIMLELMMVSRRPLLHIQYMKIIKCMPFLS